jgi:hypothetical protein
VDFEVSEFHVNIGINNSLGHASVVNVFGTGGGMVENGVNAAHGFLSRIIAFLSRCARWKDNTIGGLFWHTLLFKGIGKVVFPSFSHLGGHSFVLLVESGFEFGGNTVLDLLPFLGGDCRFLGWGSSGSIGINWGWSSTTKVESFGLSSNGSNECNKCEFHIY